MSSFYPTSGAELVVFAQSLLVYVNANLVPLGLTPAQVAPLTAALTSFQTALTNQETAQNAAQLATENKQNGQTNLETQLQNFNTQMQASPVVTDAQREGMGLPVHSKKRTAPPVPTTRPVLQIDTSQILQHTISFSDQATPERRGKPDGVRACKIFQKIGAPAPLDASQCEYLADDTKSPYVNHFGGADIGKTVYYIAFWTNSRDEIGPAGEIVSATVTG